MNLWFLLLACFDKETQDTLDTGDEYTDVLSDDTSDEPLLDEDTAFSEDTSTSDTADSNPDTGQDTGQDTAINDDCEHLLICVDSFPFQHEGNTSNSGFDSMNQYSCSPNTNESGPEIYYRVTLPHDGFLALDLPSVGNNVDVDVHLLQSLDSDTCIDRGHWKAGALLSAGDYIVVVDSWVNSSGSSFDGAYTLTMGFTSLWDLQWLGLNSNFAFDALYAFDTAWQQGETERFEYAITDFSLHSSNERMWLLDLGTGSILANLYLAHGENSSSAWDDGMATTFSNISGSHQSSLGMMKGAESYEGSYGYSMRMDGLEYGYNHNVRSRAVVVHGWTGSQPEYVNYYGAVAPTWGCPAVDDREVAYVVDTLKDGALLFFWYPDGDWNINSTFLQ